MKYRLGLDLGTNSIGWAALGMDENNSPVTIIDAGVRIFSNSRQLAKGGILGDPLAVVRADSPKHLP